MKVGVNAVGAVMGGAARHLPPFLAALHAVRPDWAIEVWASVDPGGSAESGSAEPGPASSRSAVTVVPRLSAVQRLRWENGSLLRSSTASGVDVLLNLTNSGPLRHRVPSILYQRNPIYFDRRWLRHLSPSERREAQMRRLLASTQARFSDVVVVPTPAMAGFLRSWREWPSATRIEVIPHAVDLDRFSFTPLHWPPTGRVRLLSVGHAARHKDQVLMVDIVDQARRSGLDVELLLTIDPPGAAQNGAAVEDATYAREIAERAARLEVEELVQFVGRRSDVEALYRSSDVVLLSSISESFGFCLVEAMSCGRPVLSSDIPSSMDVLGDIGFFFSVEDAADGARVLGEMLGLSHPEMNERLDRGRERVRSRGFDWKSNAERVAVLIETTMGGRTRTR